MLSEFLKVFLPAVDVLDTQGLLCHPPKSLSLSPPYIGVSSWLGASQHRGWGWGGSGGRGGVRLAFRGTRAGGVSHVFSLILCKFFDTFIFSVNWPLHSSTYSSFFLLIFKKDAIIKKKLQ